MKVRLSGYWPAFAGLVVGAGLMVSAGQAMADVYAGVALGSTSYSFEEEASTSFEVTAGTYLSPNLAMEMSFIDLGDVDWYPADAVYNVSGVNFAVKALLPLNDFVSFYAKAGVFSWESEVQYNDQYSESTAHGMDASFGLGASWYLADDFDFNLEYKTFDFEEMGDSYGSNVSAGISFRF